MARTKVFDTNTHSWVYADKSFGKDGKSAYEYAKDAGYTGSEEEFAAKLAATDTSELTRENIIDALGYTPLESYTLPAAGSSLGGVKSGGDVTISSGVITVKDDSHNHIIANIDNLGATLNGKADKSEGAFYIEGSGTTDATAKTSTWVGTSDRITDYYDGLTIRYKIGIEGQSTVTLNINNLGAKTVYRFDTTKLTTHFPVGSIIHLIYHEDLNDGCWISNDYDANTNTQQRVYATTTDKEYPITARYNNTTGETYYAEYGRYTTGVTLNPSTKTITATAFKGKLTGNADTATKATQDASGNVITTTYETKANVTTKLTEVNNQIAQLSEEKVTKSGLTLGVHTDGLVYLFVDGVPHGNGLDIKADVVGDIFGYVDENNIIILNGTLTNGTYTIKYEMADGSVIEIGDLELDSNKGNLADPTSADWLTDKRLAMVYGYTKDSVGNIFTNYIPVKSGDVIRVKGLNLYGVQNGISSAIACYSSNTDTSTDSDGALNAYTGGVYTAVTTELEENGVRDQVSQDGNIFTYTILVYNDGTQMADPETAYIRISAPLLEGYTAEEVIITVNEAIPEDNTYWFITNNLTNCKTSNTATRVVKGESYAATITAKDGCVIKSVTATMGGSAVTVNNGVINIASVTGDIVITAVAEAVDAGEPVNLAQTDSTNKTDISIWCNDARLGSDYGYRALAGNIVTNYFSFEVGDTVYIKGLTIDTTTSSMINSLSFYDSSKNGLSISNVEYYLGKRDYIDLSSDANYPYIFDTTKLGNYAQAIGTKFMRISATLSGSLSNVVINVKRNGVWVTTNGSDGSDGSGSDSGDTGSSSSYTNLLPSAIDTDGTPYGDGKGYISGYKLSCSSAGGTPSATSGAYVSGFMPINNNTDTLRIKNVTLHANANVNNIIFYNKDKTKIHGVAGLAGSFAALIRVDDGNVYRCRPGAWLSNTTAANIGFFRFSCGGITDETIVTVNEEIV